MKKYQAIFYSEKRIEWEIGKLSVSVLQQRVFGMKGRYFEGEMYWEGHVAGGRYVHGSPN